MPTATTTRRVTIRPAHTSADLKRFIDFPYTLYQDTIYWVPPLRRDIAHTLDPKKNPFFEHGKIQLFLAEDASGAVVGSIGAMKKYDDGNGFFGFFECNDDYDTAAALLDAASAWLREQGLTGMRGPANPSLNDTSGLLIDGFESWPALLMPYNPPYYEDFLLRYGFERAMTMWAYYVHYKYVQTERLQRGVNLLYRRHPDLKLRTLDMDRFDEDAQIILDLFNEAWSDNWGHVPMTPAEFAHLASDLKQIVDPKMVFILEKAGEPVAFSVSLPDLNLALRHVRNGRLLPLGLPKLLAYAQFGGIHEVRMPLMGVRTAYQGHGFSTIPILATINAGPELGYYGCEMSWVLDANKVLINALEALGATVDKEYALFEKRL